MIVWELTVVTMTITGIIAVLQDIWRWVTAEAVLVPGHGSGCQCQTCEDIRIDNGAMP